MSNEERALADPAPVARDEDVEDVTPEPDPATHDLDGMVHGDRGARVRVKVQTNGHLLADLQEIADRIDAYPSDDAVPDDLIAEWSETKAEFDRVDTYIVSGRNSDWLRHFGARLKEHGVCGETTMRDGMLMPLPGKNDEADGGGEYTVVARAVLNAQLAAQMVRIGPLGQEVTVTADEINDIYGHSEPEADKLFRAVKVANTQPVKAMVPDFSARVSRLSRRGSE